MANYIFLVVVLIFACTSAVFVPPRPGHRHHEPQQQQQKVHLLGTKECTWGPSYWCKNLTAAADCNAVKHCIQTVWIHKQLPPDTSNVCQICLDMVKQARDQLESNETQELLKEVFEGSCALLHIKPIVEECDKIADNYIPELVETLASEMNPQVVCAVAGFCNNDKFIKLAHEQIDKEETKPLLENCNNCLIVGKHLENRLQTVPFEDFTNNLLLICRKFDSFTDSCSNIILKYSFNIYQRLKTEFNPNEFCLLTGECSSIFHTHDIEITPISHIGYIDIKQDNLPCDLCKQLVTHLKDLLITNTTEIEFKRVLQGLCKQTGEFKQECLNLVEQYYSEIYNFLLTELNSSAVCAMMGLCPNQIQQPIMPLILTEENVGKALKIIPKQPQLNLLPIDLLVPPHTQILYNHQLCVFCEYFMHYLQQAITDPKSEQEIKRVIDEACQKLPSSINQTCVKFVDMYEPALIALLAQEIDPSTICPLIKACPEPNNQHDIEIFIHQQIKDNEKCPLCLFAVSKLEDMVKNEKTEENIKNALSKLCVKLPKNLADECNDFVKTYTNELIDMLIADLDPQEICVYLKLCTDNKLPDNSHLNTVGDIETNVIRDNTIDGKIAGSEPLDYHQENAECVLCEFIMKELQDQLKDNATEEEIKRIVHNICDHLPTTIKNECNDFVNEYADTIIQLLIATTVPDEICRVMHLCPDQSKLVRIHAEVLDCAICESLVYMIEKVLANPNVDHNVKHVLEKACRALPTHEQEKCIDIIEKYGKTIYELVIHLANKGLVCHEIGMCATKVARIETPIDN